MCVEGGGVQEYMCVCRGGGVQEYMWCLYVCMSVRIICNNSFKMSYAFIPLICAYSALP